MSTVGGGAWGFVSGTAFLLCWGGGGGGARLALGLGGGGPGRLGGAGGLSPAEPRRGGPFGGGPLPTGGLGGGPLSGGAGGGNLCFTSWAFGGDVLFGGGRGGGTGVLGAFTIFPFASGGFAWSTWFVTSSLLSDFVPGRAGARCGGGRIFFEDSGEAGSVEPPSIVSCVSPSVFLRFADGNEELSPLLSTREGDLRTLAIGIANTASPSPSVAE